MISVTVRSGSIDLCSVAENISSNANYAEEISHENYLE